MLMEDSPIAPIPSGSSRKRIFTRFRIVLLLALFVLLLLCTVFSWVTRDAMADLSFLRQNRTHSVGAAKTYVDLSPWLTAQALAPLAVSTEEKQFAHDAERLADHEVDQTFAAALRQANEQVEHRILTGEALELSHKVALFQQLVKQDQVLVRNLTPAQDSTSAKQGAQTDAGNDDLAIAKAQLGLDSDELDDAEKDLALASGDNRAQIQAELTAHESAMTKFNNESNDNAQVAVLSAKRHRTLALRLKSWGSQRSRYQLIQQALQRSQDDIRRLFKEHDALEAKAKATTAAAANGAPDHAAQLTSIKNRSEERQLLGIYDDRIQTEQQLATVYGKWAAQVLLQHRIVEHLILLSCAQILVILILMVFCDALVQRLLANPALDRRQMHTLRSILKLSIQVISAVLILFVIFGTPQQMPTVLGLATAGLTIALQDFIVAFIGWFVLMGKNGIHVGDWVEIDGVGGEVTEIGLINTTLLETGSFENKGQPTGRRITFLNSYAIKGKFFNFSTAGQWMWDEIAVSIPATDDPRAMIDRIREVAIKETEADIRIAEQEWQRSTHGDRLSGFSATPLVNLRPSGANIDVHVRYVTRASARFEVRNRLYQDVIHLLQEKVAVTQIQQPHPDGNA